MPFDGREIANYLLDYCESYERKITNLSLQKIIFFCHGHFLKYRERPLIKHKFEAWEHGPVLPYLYEQFKSYKDKPILRRATKLDIQTGQKITVSYKFDKETKDFLTKLIDFYSQIPASQLVQQSHEKGGAWDRVWNHEGKVNPGMRINDDDIKTSLLPPISLQ